MVFLHGSRGTCGRCARQSLYQHPTKTYPWRHRINMKVKVRCSKYITSYKHGLISPVPKIHSPVCIESDFRQISVLPQMAKVLEKVQLLLNSRYLDIRDNQHAFTKKRSTVCALVDITQSWFDSTRQHRDCP